MTNLNKPRKLASYVVDNHLYIHYYITINKLEVQDRGKEMQARTGNHKVELRWHLTSADTSDTSTHASFLLDGEKYEAFARRGSFGVAFHRPGYPGYKRIQGADDWTRMDAEAAAALYVEELNGTPA